MESVSLSGNLSKAKCPFVGVPWFDITEGRYRTALFKRSHVQAALDAGVKYARYNPVDHILTLNGGRSSYKLRDLYKSNESSMPPFEVWQVKELLETWRNGARKAAMTRAMPKDARLAYKIELEIEKLRKQHKKMHLGEPPFSPLLSRTRGGATEHVREGWRKWIAEKPIRRRLGQLVREPRKTWADFYAKAEAITGHRIDSSQRHDRVCPRKHGPSRFEYFEQFWQWAMPGGRWSKPHDRGKPWEPYKPLGWGEDHELNEFQRHRKAQVEWLVRRTEWRNIEMQIENLQAEVASLRAGSNG